MADTGLPIVCKCATLIEACKPLTQLVSEKDQTFTPQDTKVLRCCLEDIISKYGQDIFSEEIKRDFELLKSMFTDSRNRIAHIKSKQGKDVLNGDESMLYSVKFSMLYRRVIIDLLGIDYALYQDQVIAIVDKWNQLHDILPNLFKKLGEIKKQKTKVRKKKKRC